MCILLCNHKTDDHDIESAPRRESTHRAVQPPICTTQAGQPRSYVSPPSNLPPRMNATSARQNHTHSRRLRPPPSRPQPNRKASTMPTSPPQRLCRQKALLQTRTRTYVPRLHPPTCKDMPPSCTSNEAPCHHHRFLPYANPAPPPHVSTPMKMLFTSRPRAPSIVRCAFQPAKGAQARASAAFPARIITLAVRFLIGHLG